MARKKSLTKKVMRKELSEHEFDRAAEEMQQGSDRVCAIMGAALVDSSLDSPLKALIKDKEIVDKLFYGEGAPFGTFHRKTIVCRALGIIDKQTADDLDRIRDIRNQFAHALLSIDFSNADISNVTRQMKNYLHDDNLAVAKKGRDKKCSPRAIYEAAYWDISTKLERAARKIIEKQLEELEAMVRARSEASAPISGLNFLAGLLGGSAEQNGETGV